MEKYFYKNLGEVGSEKVIVHHIDMDGYSAAKHVYENSNKGKIYIPMNYNYEWDFEPFNDKDVIIVDISFTKSSITNLFKICEIAKEVRWVDHHISSKEAVDDPEIKAKLDGFTNLQYFINTNLCATVLMSVINANELIEGNNIDVESAYRRGRFIYDNNHRIDDRKVLLSLNNIDWCIDSWDRFTWKAEDTLAPMYINSAFYAMNHCLKNKILYGKNFFMTRYEEIYELGRIITDAKNKDIERALSNGYRVSNVCGYNAYVLNAPGINPTATLEDRFKKYECDIFIVWRYAGDTRKFIYSIYSREGVNAANIAQSFNPAGGGHTNAAGFVSDKLLFT